MSRDGGTNGKRLGQTPLMATEGGERLAPVVALNDFAGAESQDAVMVTIRTSSGTEDHWVVELKVQKIQPACQGKV
ncbi:hypothetical protein E4U56_004932 [Claviceps arundinis]|uniref:Uncharacterized protein n=1 Tax=Claviceps arundinis TaxID=1623583 RepID=A0A9P7MXV3_9HYPO|nr:hypothetical protein E4U56_004932 [Claviceps arundinis]